MAVGSFQVGQRYTQSGSGYRLVRNLGEGRWQAEELATDRLSETTQVELLAAWSRGELVFANDTTTAPAADLARRARDAMAQDMFAQSYPEAKWAEARAKLVFLRELGDAPLTKSVVDPRIKEIWEDGKLWRGGRVLTKMPPFSTVARWRQMYRSAGNDVRALIARVGGSTVGTIDPLVEEMLEDAIDLLYMTPERATLAEVREHVRGLVAKANVGRLEGHKLKAPEYDTVKRRVAQITPYDRCRARYGLRIANIRFRAAGQGAPSESPLARACMDHCRLDVVVVDDDSWLLLGRPWLTLVLDESTRYILGYYIGFEEPSNVSVMRAMRHAIMPKADFLGRFPTLVHGWDAWGPAQTLVVDNGLEFHGETIRNGADRFGTVVQFCPRRKPWFKGKIERLFGTINSSLLATIPGKTFSNILEKGDYDPAKHAVLRLTTFREILATWIVDVYHQQPHRTLGCSPAQAWAEKIQAVDRWLPANSLVVDSAFSKREHRRLTHKGIEYDSLFYNGPELRHMREQHGENIEVEIRVMDDDLGSIIVVAPGGTELVRVAAIDAQYAKGLTRWQHGVCKRYQRRLCDDESLQVTLFDAKARIRELIRADMGLINRSSRKRQARFNESTGMPVSPVPEVSALATTAEASLAVPATAAPPASPTPKHVTPKSPPKPSPPAAPTAVFTLTDDDDLPDFGSRRISPTKELAA